MSAEGVCANCGHPAFYHGVDQTEVCTGPQLDEHGDIIHTSDGNGARRVLRCGCVDYEAAPVTTTPPETQVERPPVSVTFPVQPGSIVICRGLDQDLTRALRAALVQVVGHEQFLVVALDGDAALNVITLTDAIELLERELTRAQWQQEQSCSAG